ncbi:uncharacterized protein [Argopecten irradians]|uniref:uncharacterized protein n=1 Tax=Argopecten irradians TaxID=31199 RepID=UPI00371C87DB
MSTSAVTVPTESGIPRSRGVFDPLLGRFVDSATKKPVGEVDTEEYLERLRMVHSQHLGLSPSKDKTILSQKEKQGTEGGTGDDQSSKTKWGKYIPYSSPTEPQWYKIKTPKISLWDNLLLRVREQLDTNALTPVSGEKVASQSPEVSKTSPSPEACVTSHSPEDVAKEKTDGPKVLVIQERMKVGKKRIAIILQSLLCCCRQNHLA